MSLEVSEELLARVDDATRAALVELARYEPEDGTDRTHGYLVAVLEAAGFGTHRELTPLPEELDEVQWAVARFFAELPPRTSFTGRSVPSQPWKVRRWLRLDGQEGVLERVVTVGAHTEPLWRVLQRAQLEGRNPKAVVAELGLSTGEQLEVFGDSYFRAYDVPWPREAWVSTAAITSKFGDWGRATADRLLEGLHGSTTNLIRVPVVLALVRGSVPIEPRWDSLLFAGPDLVPLMEECFETLPAERRDRALASAIRNSGFATDRVRTAIAMLRKWPSAAITQVIVENADGAAAGPSHSRIPKSQLKRMMKHRADRIPEVGRVWKAYLAGRPAPIVLERLAVSRPAADETLAPTLAEQIEAAGELYDGQALSAVERLSGGPDAEWSFEDRLEVRRLRNVDTGAQYDAFIVEPDTATVFEAGTTKEVAMMIQGGVECADEALREALREALAP